MSASPGNVADRLGIKVLVPAINTAEEASAVFLQKVRCRPSSLELVYLPFVLFRYRLSATKLFGGMRQETGAILVDLNGGVPINIRKGASISGPEMEWFEGAIEVDGNERVWGKGKRTGPHFAVQLRQVPSAAVAPAHIPVEEAIGEGLRILRYEFFRLLGPLRYRRLEMRAEEPHALVYHPYWIFYTRKRNGEKTYDILDALNGVKEGGQIFRSVARALFGAPDPRSAARA